MPSQLASPPKFQLQKLKKNIYITAIIKSILTNSSIIFHNVKELRVNSHNNGTGWVLPSGCGCGDRISTERGFCPSPSDRETLREDYYRHWISPQRFPPAERETKK